MHSNWSSRANAHWLAAAAFVVLAAVGCNDDDAPGTQEQNPVAMPPAAGTSAAGTAAPAAGSGGAGRVAGAAGSRAGASGGIAGQSAGAAAPDDDAGSEPTETPDAGTPPAGDSGTTTEPPARADLGKGDGSDVITIGDSWMSLGATGIQQSLVKASGQPYRTYGRGGTRLLNEVIPGQYTTAKRADPDIKTVVMTGGGNDIIQVPGLRDDCTAMGAQCAMVVGQILDRLTKLWTEMAADGVQDVIYVQYSNPEGNNVDYAQASGDGLAKRCAEAPAPLRCHRVETLDIVMGDIPDGIHPSAVAYDRLGVAVHDLMTAKGMRR
jgi:lysophospholipase L1-like esterase